jgi:hypothetical protein
VIYFFSPFDFSHCIFGFSNSLLHAGIFLAFFYFYKNSKDISEIENPLKNISWTFSRSNVGPGTQAWHHVALEETMGQACQQVRPAGGRPNPGFGRTHLTVARPCGRTAWIIRAQVRIPSLYRRHDLNALQMEQPNGLSSNIPMKPPDSRLIKRTSHKGESRDTITVTFLQHRHK